MKTPKPPENFNVDGLCQDGMKAMRIAFREAFKFIDYYPEEAFAEVTKDGKKALFVDNLAEAQFKVALGDRCTFITAHGEESLGRKVPDDQSLDLRAIEGIYALADIVDGTDLLERGLSNWCSACCFFQPTAPPGSRIIASFVRLTSGEIYYSTSMMADVLCQPSEKRPSLTVAGPSTITELINASVSFYGQKAANLNSIFKENSPELAAQESLLEYVIRIDSEREKRRKEKEENGELITEADEPIPFRIYTLAGIPMIVKLIDHRIKNAKNIDVVFDLRGQQPHDVVPGAYLAIKAKATMRKLWVDSDTKEGKYADMTLEDLEQSLMRPAASSSKLSYVIASTKELADEITPLLLPLLLVSR